MVNNQAIMHAAHRPGGEPFCKNRNAHMSTSVDRFRIEPKQCKRCLNRVRKMDDKARAMAECDGAKFHYTLRVGATRPGNLPVDIREWDYAGTDGALVIIYLPRVLTEWECEHYGLTPAAPPAPKNLYGQMIEEDPTKPPAGRVLVIYVNSFTRQIIGGYVMINGRKASATLTTGEIGASIIENPKQRVDLLLV